MILNILISLGITIGFLAILGALSLIIIYVVTNIDGFIGGIIWTKCPLMI